MNPTVDYGFTRLKLGCAAGVIVEPPSSRSPAGRSIGHRTCGLVRGPLALRCAQGACYGCGAADIPQTIPMDSQLLLL